MLLLDHTGTGTIETQRLILRKFEKEDIKSAYENWMSIPEVQNNYGETICETVMESQEIIEKWISLYDNKDFYRWSICLKDSNISIGQIAFYSFDSKNHKADVEYCIGQSYWGNGYAPEALKAIIEYSFKHIHLNRIQAFHRSRNAVSGKVLVKAGMNYEGTMKQYLIHKGEFDDCIMYAIIRDEWNQK